LLPKNSKHFVQPTAEELDCNLTIVEDAVGFFYQELRKALVEMKAPGIQVTNLGTFKAKPGELPKLVHKYEKHLEVLQPETFNQHSLRKELETRLARVKGLQAQINEERDRRREFMKAKDERNKKNLG